MTPRTRNFDKALQEVELRDNANELEDTTVATAEDTDAVELTPEVFEEGYDPFF